MAMTKGEMVPGHGAGCRTGREWAEKFATPDELTRLSAAAELNGGQPPTTTHDAFSGAERVAFWTMAEGERDRQAASDFWFNLDLKVSDISHDFLQGFIAGATLAV